jgi:hypothetical protein
MPLGYGAKPNSSLTGGYYRFVSTGSLHQATVAILLIHVFSSELILQIWKLVEQMTGNERPFPAIRLSKK